MRVTVEGGNMKTVPRSIVRGVGSFAIACAMSVPLSAQVKVEEQVVGPMNSVGFVVSPHGVHLASSTMQGSRYVMVVDGVEGPKFDEPPKPPVFSSDGKHFAYFGHQGGEYVVILDGKEIARGPGTPIGTLSFTPTGKHFFYVEGNDKTGEKRFMMDGKAGPPTLQNLGAPVFSNDESRYAYALKKSGKPETNIMVVDGKEVPYVGDHLSFSGDGKSIISMLQTIVKTSLQIDGKPLPGLPSTTPMGTTIQRHVVSPVGVRVATIVQNTKGPTRVFLNDKPIVGVEDDRVLDFQFSPDGRRYAALCATRIGSQYVVIDGKRGQEYKGVDNLGFTPDSSKAFYTAVTGTGHNFVVVEDKESDAFQSLFGKPVVGGKGARIGFVGFNDRGLSVVVIDGAALPPRRPYVLQGNMLTFSADGSRYAFVAASNSRLGGYTLVVDGVEQAAAVYDRFQDEGNPYPPPSLLFSPDGKYIVYAGRSTDGKGGEGLWINDKLVFQASGQHLLRPSFSPDGQHVVWASIGKDHAIYLDGEEVMRFALSSLDGTPGTLELGSDGVLMFLAPAENVIKRYRVTPSTNTSVAGLLAQGVK